MSTRTAVSAPKKLDLYQQHKAEYATPRDPVLLDIGKAQYLAIDGRGAPGGSAFDDAVGALYAMAFTIKMESKKAGRDYGVAKLEAQWWLDSGHDFVTAPKDSWNWRLLIRTPEFITARECGEAQTQLLAKGKAASIAGVRLLPLAEGKCVQVLHAGSYDREAETICRMHAFAREKGFEFHHLHHEIYLSDPRRVAPEKLRTILRMPVRAQA